MANSAPNDLVIGCHLSSGKGYEAMARTAQSIGANTFAFFTRNPRGGAAKAIDPADIERFEVACEEIGMGPIVAHGSYTINPCSAKESVREFALQALTDDLARMEFTPGQLFNMHPGSHTGQGVETGIDQIAEILNQVITPDQTTTAFSGPHRTGNNGRQRLRSRLDLRRACSHTRAHGSS